MTEYDYSPEAYERYLATQTRIANWVDTTESHRREFEPALNAVPPTAPTVKRPAPRPAPLPMQPYGAPPMGPYAVAPPPPRRSPSADTYEYGPGPGPMPLPGGYAPHPAYAPMLPPGAHQAYLLPAHRSHSHSHSHSHGHHSHGHGHPRRHHSQGYYTTAAPPVSPTYAAPYGYPAPGGYFVMQQPPAPGHVMVSPPSTWRSRSA